VGFGSYHIKWGCPFLWGQGEQQWHGIVDSRKTVAVLVTRTAPEQVVSSCCRSKSYQQQACTMSI
jgi:hypothetical protein